MHGQAFVSSAEGLVWAIAKLMVGSLFLSGHDVVVVDATNTTVKRQEDWNDVAEQVSATIMYKVIYCTPQECRDRAKEGHREFLIPVIDRMSENWEHPPADMCL
jgi:predicted kinase